MSIGRNVGYNLISTIASIAIMLISVPLYIAYLGEERFGTISLIWLIASTLFFLDLGTGIAVRYQLSKRHDAADEERATIFWTGIWLSLGLGIVAAVIVYFGAWVLFRDYINMSDVVRAEAISVLPWIALNLPLATVWGVLSGALISRERFLSLNMFQLMANFCTQLLPLLAVMLLGASLRVAVPATMLARLLTFVFLLVAAFRSVPAGIRPQFGDRKLVVSLMSYGLWSSGETFGKQILLNMDRFVVGSLISAQAVAYYSAPSNLILRGQMVSRAFTEAIFPRASRMPEDQRRQTLLRALTANCAVATVMAAGAIMAVEPFFAIWINPDFAANASIPGQIISLTLVPLAAAEVAATFLRASGRPKETMTVIFIELVPFCVGLYFGSLWFGLLGAALARLGRCVLDALLMAKSSGIMERSITLMLHAGVLCAIALVVAEAFVPVTVASLLVKSAVLMLVIGWAGWISPELRRKSLDILGHLIRRIARS